MLGVCKLCQIYKCANPPIFFFTKFASKLINKTTLSSQYTTNALHNLNREGEN